MKLTKVFLPDEKGVLNFLEDLLGKKINKEDVNKDQLKGYSGGCSQTQDHGSPTVLYYTKSRILKNQVFNGVSIKLEPKDISRLLSFWSTQILRGSRVTTVKGEEVFIPVLIDEFSSTYLAISNPISRFHYSRKKL